jgi:hypothetical protein
LLFFPHIYIFFFVNIILVWSFHWTMTNLLRETCRAHKVRSPLQLNFLHTYESEIDLLIICLRGLIKTLTTWTNSLLVLIFMMLLKITKEINFMEKIFMGLFFLCYFHRTLLLAFNTQNLMSFLLYPLHVSFWLWLCN